MCFSIPQKITAVFNRTVITQMGGTYALPPDTEATPGMYARVSGEWVIDVLSVDEGKAICDAITEVKSKKITTTSL